ncbi:putative oxidoreductase YcjS [compost metagenome]
MDNYKPKYAVGNAYHKLSGRKNAANAWGPWDPEKFTVEDSAIGFITMENGATIVLEASWALNTLDVGEAKTALCGTEGGADMEKGLRINGEAYGKTYEKHIGLDAAGVDFYDGAGDDPALAEAVQWIDSIINDTEPVVKPEQALVVTRILEAIYKSSETGMPVFFD